MTNKEAYLVLSLLPYIGPIVSRKLLEIVDKSSDIFSFSLSQLSKKVKLQSRQLESLANWQKYVDLEKEKKILEKSKVHFIPYIDKHYSVSLKEIYDPPIALYAQGNISLLSKDYNNFAVVGSRRCTGYGQKVTRNLVSSLINSDWTIISGLALGIDSFAHTEALNCSGKTIAVLGSGLGNVYPPNNIALLKNIIENEGLVISEFSLLKKPDKTTFPMRNRIIAGLSQGVLIVEAGTKSGSLITANMALEQGKQVFAVPGNIDRFSSQGCNQLIKQGASMVTCFEDIVQEYDNFSELFQSEENIEEKRQINLQLSELEESIIKFIALEEDVVSFDDIVVGLGIESSNLFVLLVKLETKKLLKVLPGRQYILSDYVKDKLCFE